MTDEKGEVEFFQFFSWNDGRIAFFTAAAEGWGNLGVALIFWVREEVVGHVLDEDTFTLDEC